SEAKVREKVQKVEEELREWLRLRKEEAKGNVHRLNSGRKELHEIKEKYFPSVEKREMDQSPGGIKIGERVKIVSLRSRGVVTSVEEASSLVEVMTEKAKVRTSFSDIVRLPGGEEEAKISEPPVSAQGSAPEPPSQINVIGLTVEDALPRVDKFIDQALLHGLEKIQIIHGVGSGRLRAGIAKYLEGHRGVKRFVPGEAAKGGRGVTIVELI
ncbi:MAG TPA: Smr/MutS family protein, partial [bacterium]|nr:Smr/MutS family protein [bacterium]